MNSSFRAPLEPANGSPAEEQARLPDGKRAWGQARRHPIRALICTHYELVGVDMRPDGPAGAAMTKEIVIVCLTIELKTGTIIPNAFFLVKASRADRSSVFGVVDQTR
jgi:hypothetical protein